MTRGRWDEPGTGKRGFQGLSAYEIAKRNDPNVGTEQQWLESLRGPPGPSGDGGSGGGGGSGTVTSVSASGSPGLTVGGSPITTSGVLTLTLSANLQAWNGIVAANKVDTTRTIATTAPLAGGGDLSANRTLSITAATTVADGSMSAADKTKLDSMASGASVSSVAVTGSTGLVVGGSPITSAGTITLTLDTGLQALASYNTSAFLVQTSTNVFAGRTLTGTASRLSVTNGTGVAGNPVFDIDVAYPGQTSIVTLGTVTTGTWGGTAVAANKGGTGLTAFTAGNYLNAATTSTLQERTPAQVKSDIGAASSGVVTASGLTMATARLLGRSTAAVGAIEEITVGAGLTLSGGSLTASGGGTVADADYGDITVSGSGTAWAIDAGAVTLAKMANIATDSLIGRDTAASGVPEIITLGASLGMSGAQVLRRAALTGDVTAAVDSNATTIANAAVTLAKMANLAANSIIGNNTGGAAVPLALTAAQVRTLLGIETCSSGTYTPTASNTVNIDVITPHVCQWSRVGNVVTVSGYFDIDTTAAANTLTQFQFTLPVASAITALEQIAGVSASNAVNEAGIILANIAGDRAACNFLSTVTTSRAVTFTMTYLVI